jgi:putative transposase
MARIARVVAPGYAYHITQRRKRRQQVFFGDADYRAYLDLLEEWCARHEVEVWAYCLMANHVHLMAVPHSQEGLAKAIGETHRRYTRLVNFREGWRGYLWQGRFASFPLERSHGVACARYIELNPVRAKLVDEPEAWAWSSARAHITGKYDGLIKCPKPLAGPKEWRSLLGLESSEREARAIRQSERTGRPLGSGRFISRLENLLDRPLKKRKPGRKRTIMRNK